MNIMKAYLWLIFRKTVSALRERWDLTLENVALKHQLDVLERSGKRLPIYKCRSAIVGHLVNRVAPVV